LHLLVWYYRIIVKKTYIRKFEKNIGPSRLLEGPTFVLSKTNKLSNNNNMKAIKKVFLAVAILISGSAVAQERPMHEVYSMMMFNFVKYVQWPDQTASGDFVIGVIGNGEVYNTLNSWYGGKPRNGQTYVIKSYKSAAEMGECDVVFIDKTKSGEFEAVKNKVAGKGTLLITDKAGLGEKGSAINFRTVDNKLKFELNQKAVEASNLKVSSALTSMAIVI
jgi:YfiR/HmsC-like